MANVNTDVMPGMVSAALEIAKRRAVLLDRVRKALLTKDDLTAIELMKDYCGLSDEKGDRTNSRIN